MIIDEPLRLNIGQQLFHKSKKRSKLAEKSFGVLKTSPSFNHIMLRKCLNVGTVPKFKINKIRIWLKITMFVLQYNIVKNNNIHKKKLNTKVAARVWKGTVTKVFGYSHQLSLNRFLDSSTPSMRRRRRNGR